eukprot:scaffold17121_cov60-Attheya_sp.AAC.13
MGKKRKSPMKKTKKEPIMVRNVYYGCPECVDRQKTWTQCMSHMKNCCPHQLENKKLLRPQRYRLGHVQSIVPDLPNEISPGIGGVQLPSSVDTNIGDTIDSNIAGDTPAEAEAQEIEVIQCVSIQETLMEKISSAESEGRFFDLTDNDVVEMDSHLVGETETASAQQNRDGEITISTWKRGEPTGLEPLDALLETSRKDVEQVKILSGRLSASLSSTIGTDSSSTDTLSASISKSLQCLKDTMDRLQSFVNANTQKVMTSPTAVTEIQTVNAMVNRVRNNVQTVCNSNVQNSSSTMTNANSSQSGKKRKHTNDTNKKKTKKNKTFLCPTCSKPFHNDAKLVRHALTKHGQIPPGPKKFGCLSCGYLSHFYDGSGGSVLEHMKKCCPAMVKKGVKNRCTLADAKCEVPPQPSASLIPIVPPQPSAVDPRTVKPSTHVMSTRSRKQVTLDTSVQNSKMSTHKPKSTLQIDMHDSDKASETSRRQEPTRMTENNTSESCTDVTQKGSTDPIEPVVPTTRKEKGVSNLPPWMVIDTAPRQCLPQSSDETTHSTISSPERGIEPLSGLERTTISLSTPMESSKRHGISNLPAWMTSVSETNDKLVHETSVHNLKTTAGYFDGNKGKACDTSQRQGISNLPAWMTENNKRGSDAKKQKGSADPREAGALFTNIEHNTLREVSNLPACIDMDNTGNRPARQWGENKYCSTITSPTRGVVPLSGLPQATMPLSSAKETSERHGISNLPARMTSVSCTNDNHVEQVSSTIDSGAMAIGNTGTIAMARPGMRDASFSTTAKETSNRQGISNLPAWMTASSSTSTHSEQPHFNESESIRDGSQPALIRTADHNYSRLNHVQLEPPPLNASVTELMIHYSNSYYKWKREALQQRTIWASLPLGSVHYVETKRRAEWAEYYTDESSRNAHYYNSLLQ